MIAPFGGGETDRRERSESTDKFRVGTCSWEDLPGFYPDDMPQERHLSYYARHFSVVEVNTTRYGPPRVSTVVNWVRRTPENFRFCVKPPGNLTWTPEWPGEKPAEPSLEIARAFCEAMRPLADAGKLSALTVQFPRSFENTTEHCDYIKRLPDLFRDYLIAVEFRRRDWLDDQNAVATFELLRNAGLAYMMVDEPQVGLYSVPPIYAVTNPMLAIVRFHGRNVETWNSRDPNVVPTEWMYTEGQLAEWVPNIQRAAKEAKTVHLFINTTSQGQGPKTVRLLERLLGIEPPPPVERQMSLFG